MYQNWRMSKYNHSTVIYWDTTGNSQETNNNKRKQTEQLLTQGISNTLEETSLKGCNAYSVSSLAGHSGKG